MNSLTCLGFSTK